MTRIAISLLAVLLAFGQSRAWAEDIDLFVGAYSGTPPLANVLFVVDNTANWTQAFQNEMAALQNTFNNLPVNPDGSARFNVGVMFASETGSTDSNISGGYVRAAMRPMGAVNKAKYAAMIAALDVGADRGNGGASSLVMAEAYRYLSGGQAYAGNNKAKADYAGNTTAEYPNSATSASRTSMRDIYDLPGNALTSKGAANYSPPQVGGCDRTYIIYISNGASQDSNSILTTANSMLAAAGGSTTQITLSPSGSQTNVSDEWARFLKASPLGVTTYTIDVDPRTTGQGPGWTAVLRSMATVSGGDYTAVSSASGSAAIAAAVQRALSEIQAVNSVFSSVSLPLTANTQGAYSNQIYIGMFRPDANALPRWHGNLKQYQLGRTNGILRLHDADGRDAINSLNGTVTECARSFWTATSPDGYWGFRPAGDCIPPAGSASDLYRNSNGPDGSIVEKGAQGFLLRASNPASRRVQTCSASSCTSLTNFNTSNASITAAALGVTASERDGLINWARGQDLDNENNNASTTELRPSGHGDVVHSRPVAIDFGSTNSPQVVTFYGGNEGMLRAINGNRSTSIGSVGAGEEFWAFMPPEFYGHLQRLRTNTLQVSFPNISNPSAPKPYGMDGPISVHRGASEAWVYATMRRGGRALYAFSVNNSDPSDIRLKWKRGCPNNFSGGAVSDSGCTLGFEEMGQTWSAATPFRAAGYAAGGVPLLIMGGGYDTCEDSDPHTCTASSKGRKIYVLNADTGDLLRTFDTDRSIVADAVIVPDQATNLAAYAYIADLGGNVYRLNIGTAAPLSWTVTKIAALGCDDGGSCINRKFMFAPDVLYDNGEYTLLLGSGDREKPLLSYASNASVRNHFFTLRDRPADATWLAGELSTCGAPVLCLRSLLAITTAATPSANDLAQRKGWYLALRPTEQVVTAALTIFGSVTFSTHSPDVSVPGTCSARLGTARVYNVSYANAQSTRTNWDRSAELPPDTGLPPSPVAGMTSIDGRLVPFCFGCSDESAIQAEEPPFPSVGLPIQPKGRVYWYVER